MRLRHTDLASELGAYRCGDVCGNRGRQRRPRILFLHSLEIKSATESL